MKKGLLILIALLCIVPVLSARELVDYELPFGLGTIAWPEVGRRALETDRDSFELEGPEERYFDISLECELSEDFWGTPERFIAKEYREELRDKEEDLREDRADYEVLESECDDNVYYYLIKVEDRLGEYFVARLGLLDERRNFYEFKGEFLEDDLDDVERIMESLSGLVKS